MSTEEEVKKSDVWKCVAFYRGRGFNLTVTGFGEPGLDSVDMMIVDVENFATISFTKYGKFLTQDIDEKALHLREAKKWN